MIFVAICIRTKSLFAGQGFQGARLGFHRRARTALRRNRRPCATFARLHTHVSFSFYFFSIKGRTANWCHTKVIKGESERKKTLFIAASLGERITSEVSPQRSPKRTWQVLSKLRTSLQRLTALTSTEYAMLRIIFRPVLLLFDNEIITFTENQILKYQQLGIILHGKHRTRIEELLRCFASSRFYLSLVM